MVILIVLYIIAIALVLALFHGDPSPCDDCETDQHCVACEYNEGVDEEDGGTSGNDGDSK